MGGVSRALASAAREAGASLRRGAPVRRVLVRDGRATGVELEDGETIEARRVVSNAHPITTYLELVGEQHLPDEVVRDVRRFRTRSGSVKVNAALSAIPDAPAWPRDAPEDWRRGLIAVAPSIEYLERAWDDAKYGRPSGRPYVEAIFPTVHEPELAPDGMHVMLAFAQYAPYQLADGTWEEERERFGRRVLDTVGEHMPGLADRAEYLEVLAPPDLESRFGLVGGNIMQGEMTPDQSFSLRPIFGYGDYTTPIEGLHLCGAGTHPGGGVMGVPGRNCAQVVIRAARRERRRASLARLRGRP
jgi:phytoene dehydrogenase-like protein